MSQDIKIPGYEILEKLGAGSAGSVYKARQLSMDRLVAVKVLPAKFAGDKAFIERFYSEARAVARLNHPHIVTGIDVGCADNTYYFVMEFVDGETAAHKLVRQGPYKEAEALALTRQVALALDHAFKNGIVHRDVKPANILTTREGVAKLADLGVASLTTSSSAGGGGAIMGTPYYMSPEAAKGEDDIDIRSDIYSLGATLYHLLSGKPPFHGNPANTVLAKQVTEEPAPLREVRPDASKRVEALIAQMMHKDRDARFSSPNELVGAIDRLAVGQTDVHPKHRRTVKPAGTPVPSRLKLVLALGGSLGILLGIAALLMLSGGPEDKTPSVAQPSVRPVIAAAKTPEPPASQAEQTAPKPAAQVSPEDKARQALEEIASSKSPLALRIEAYEGFLVTYKGMEAAKVAEERLAELLRARAEEEELKTVKARIQEILAEAQRLIEIGDLANAWKLARAETAQGALAKAALDHTAARVDQMCRDELVRVGRRAQGFAAEGRPVEARREVRSLVVEGAPELEQLAREAFAAVDLILDELRQKESQEQLQRALVLYGELIKAVDPLIAEQNLDGAEDEIRRALGREEFRQVGDLLREDLKLIDQLRTGLREIARGGEALSGQTRSFDLRDGSKMAGTVKGASAKNIEIESRIGSGRSAGSFSVRVDFTKLATEEVVSLSSRAKADPADESNLRLALVFHVFGDAEAADARLSAAGEAGVDIAPASRRFGLGRRLENAAQALLEETRAAYLAGDYPKAAALLQQLQSKFSDTDAFKKNYRTGDERGWVTVEHWRDIQGPRLNRLMQSEKFPDSPDEVFILTELELPPDRGENYGERVRGYFLPPQNGKYVFAISGDDETELHMSADADPGNKVRIAHVPTSTAPRTWDAVPSQRSEPIELAAGNRYYFELLHKDGRGTDHCAVMAVFPDGTTALPLGGRHIAPYGLE